VKTISLCMIVKNEEHVLNRCLDSICDLVDEIIIVDTGSNDRTKEIASQYTKNIFDFMWVNDFSVARNYSFSKATMDYIYVADADEFLDEENRCKFQKLKNALLSEIEIVQMMYCNQLEHNTTYNFDEEYRPKLYKRQRNFVWQDCIHESVRLEPIVFDSDIRIQHRPTSNHGKRDFKAFLGVILEGRLPSRKIHNMYARELFITGEKEDFLEAEAFFRSTIADTIRSVEEIKEAACVLAKVARLKNDIPMLLKYASKELASEPSSELCFELGEYYFEQKDYNEAIIWFYNATFETSSILNIHYSKDMPLNRLKDCYYLLGNEEQALQYGELAQDSAPVR